MARLVGRFASSFDLLDPTPQAGGRNSLSKAVVLIFPQMCDEDGEIFIDVVQNRCKVNHTTAITRPSYALTAATCHSSASPSQPQFVTRGLMLGELHRFNKSPGLRNPGWYPLRTPFPALAIRPMVPSDLPFLSMDKYPPAQRVAFLKAFLKVHTHWHTPCERTNSFPCSRLTLWLAPFLWSRSLLSVTRQRRAARPRRWLRPRSCWHVLAVS